MSETKHTPTPPPLVIHESELDKVKRQRDELLEALEEVLEDYGIYEYAVSNSGKPWTDLYMETGDKIKSAIAKAKGETNDTKNQ